MRTIRPIKYLSLASLLALGGCSATPMSANYANHFGSAADSDEYGKCMEQHNMFRSRQLMVAPTAVENAWTYCVRQTEVWYPGKDDGRGESSQWLPASADTSR